ncbi:MAG: hypothetical protein ACK532_07255, partial [Acidobacteriota bacterium]
TRFSTGKLSRSGLSTEMLVTYCLDMKFIILTQPSEIILKADRINKKLRIIKAVGGFRPSPAGAGANTGPLGRADGALLPGLTWGCIVYSIHYA